MLVNEDLFVLKVMFRQLGKNCSGSPPNLNYSLKKLWQRDIKQRFLLLWILNSKKEWLNQRQSINTRKGRQEHLLIYIHLVSYLNQVITKLPNQAHPCNIMWASLPGLEVQKWSNNNYHRVLNLMVYGTDCKYFTCNTDWFFDFPSVEDQSVLQSTTTAPVREARNKESAANVEDLWKVILPPFATVWLTEQIIIILTKSPVSL